MTAHDKCPPTTTAVSHRHTTHTHTINELELGSIYSGVKREKAVRKGRRETTKKYFYYMFQSCKVSRKATRKMETSVSGKMNA
jgi:hypothetical protein